MTRLAQTGTIYIFSLFGLAASLLLRLLLCTSIYTHTCTNLDNLTQFYYPLMSLCLGSFYSYHGINNGHDASVSCQGPETQGHQWIIELGKVQEGMDSEGVDNQPCDASHVYDASVSCQGQLHFFLYPDLYTYVCI
jgi:hypothetical protein